MSITFKNTKRGMSISAAGKDANALFEAMTNKKGKHAKVLNPLIAAAQFNNDVHVGQYVDYRSYPDAAPQRFKTRCPAEVLSGHTAVVWLDGKSGCVCVDACTPVAKDGAA